MKNKTIQTGDERGEPAPDCKTETEKGCGGG